MVWLAALGLAGLCVPLWPLWRRHVWLHLPWPRRPGYHGLTWRVEQYFIWRGWKLRPVDCREYQFIVSHNAEEFAVRCYPAGLRSFHTSVRDLLDANVVGKRKIIYIAVEPASRDEVLSARDRGVFIVPHRLMPVLAALDPATASSISDMVGEFAANFRPGKTARA